MYYERVYRNYTHALDYLVNDQLSILEYYCGMYIGFIHKNNTRSKKLIQLLGPLQWVKFLSKEGLIQYDFGSRVGTSMLRYHAEFNKQSNTFISVQASFEGMQDKYEYRN